MSDGVTPEGADVELRTGVERAAGKQAETEQGEATSWSSLMDKMEASKETQGDYFLKIGQKTPEGDRRALILREKVTGPIIGTVTDEMFVAIERKSVE